MGRAINASFAPTSSKRFNLEDRAFYKKAARYLINYSRDRSFDLVRIPLRNKEISYPKSEIDRITGDFNPDLAINMLSIILREIDEE